MNMTRGPSGNVSIIPGTPKARRMNEDSGSPFLIEFSDQLPHVTC